MTLKRFKSEYRGLCTDTWANALDAWFECAGRMNRRGMVVPPEWQYNPAAGGDGTDRDSYWYYLFGRCGNNQLQVIGAFLFRYCEYLRFKGCSY